MKSNLNRIIVAVHRYGLKKTLRLLRIYIFNILFNFKLRVLRSGRSVSFIQLLIAVRHFTRIRGFKALISRMRNSLKYGSYKQDSKRIMSQVSQSNTIKLSEKTKHVLVTNNFEWASHYYRAKNIDDALHMLGHNTLLVSESDFPSIDWTSSKELTHVWFFRTKLQFFQIQAFRELMESLVIVFDVDDLTFSIKETTKENIPVLKEIQEQDANWLLKGYLWRQINILKYCDFITAPTQRILDEGQLLTNTAGILIPNVLPREIEIHYSREQSKRATNNRIIIGYESGSNTHKEDFKAAANSLFRILHRFENTELHIFGFNPIEVSSIPKSLESRIKVLRPSDYLDFMRNYPKIDIAIAPLQINAYTESKSALKFVHAAFNKIPVIATPTRPFIEAIENGLTGLLANTEQEWETALSNLIENSELREALGEAAYQTAKETFTIKNITEFVSQVANSNKRNTEVESSERKIIHQIRSKPIIYTSLFGNYEGLLEQNRVDKSAFNLVCLTDQNLTSKTWNIEKVDALFPHDLSRSSRHPKILPNHYFGNSATSLYIDNSVYLEKCDSSIFSMASGSSLKLFRHSFHESLLREFKEVISRELDSEERILEQYSHYVKVLGDLRDIPLYWCGFMVRQHSSSEMTDLMQTWWHHVLRYSRRDQLSFSYCTYVSTGKLDIIELDNNSSNFHRWPMAHRLVDRASDWRFEIDRSSLD